MGMLNNTKVRVTYPLEELLQIAFKQLVRQELVPYTHRNVPTDYEPRYNAKNKDGKVITNIDEVTVTFGLVAKNEEKEEPYEEGGWKDPNLANE